jgi:carbamoyltransferase
MSTAGFTLGINAAFHDCSATLVRDGVVIAAAEEERFTHVKHGKRPLPFTAWQLPFHAIDYCLKEAGIALGEVERIAYSFDPRLFQAGDSAPSDVTALPATDEAPLDLPEQITLPLQPSQHGRVSASSSPWDPLFLSYVVNAPRMLASGAPHHLQARFRGVTVEQISQRWRWVEHHLAHEASAFLAAPFERCAVLTLDGRGERATTSCGVFDGTRYRRLRQVNVPHSLGLLYEQVTDYLGFLRSSDEYKVMALASYGEPAHVAEFREMIELDGKGGYRIYMPDLQRLFGPARRRGAALEQQHYDIARSLQQVLEETVLSLALWLHQASGSPNLALAGGVALNCVMNAHLRDAGPFEQVWAQPAAGDAGTALGAALWVDWNERARAGERSRPWRMEHACLGPQYGDAEIEQFLQWSKLPYRKLDDVAEDVAELLAQDRIIGWYQGRLEFGPRALGARSILASPISPDMQRRLNEIKDREDFRPVAPVVLEERAGEWFTRRRQVRRAVVNAPPLPEGEGDGFPAPFMLFVFDVPPDKAARIPAVRHVDGTARVQTIRREHNPRYYDLIAAFERRTGVPVLVNTSFNTRGEPIVCTPRDAVESFWTSPLDALVIGSFLLEKGG